MTILPTVLFLITGVLKETALKSADNSVPLPVSAALQGIKTIITSPLAQVESIQTQWASLVRSSLASVLEHSEPGEHTRSCTQRRQTNTNTSLHWEPKYGNKNSDNGNSYISINLSNTTKKKYLRSCEVIFSDVLVCRCIVKVSWRHFVRITGCDISGSLDRVTSSENVWMEEMMILFFTSNKKAMYNNYFGQKTNKRVKAKLILGNGTGLDFTPNNSPGTKFSPFFRNTCKLQFNFFRNFRKYCVCFAQNCNENPTTAILLLRLFIFLDESRPDTDEVSMLTAVTLFLLSASNELVGVTVLQKGCMDRFRNALNSSDPWVSTLCAHTSADV